MHLLGLASLEPTELVAQVHSQSPKHRIFLNYEGLDRQNRRFSLVVCRLIRVSCMIYVYVAIQNRSIVRIGRTVFRPLLHGDVCFGYSHSFDSSRQSLDFKASFIQRHIAPLSPTVAIEYARTLSVVGKFVAFVVVNLAR